MKTYIACASILTLALLVTGTPQPAAAYTPGACAQDGEKLCPGKTGKELTPCLKQHEKELSMPCQVNLAEARQAVREVMEGCESDIQKFCPNVEPGQGRIRRCLKENENQLSTTCKNTVHAAKKKFQAALPPAEPPAVSTTTP